MIVDHKAAAQRLAAFAATIDVAALPIHHVRVVDSIPKLLARTPSHWPRCTHSGYHLTCDEYEMLDLEADGFCDLCRRDFSEARRALAIDHDHAQGWRAVRGLVCSSCNSTLAGVDAGWRTPDRDMADYLANPWHERVGLEGLTCPTSCGFVAHRLVVPQPVQEVRPIVRFTPAQQRRHIEAQLW